MKTIAMNEEAFYELLNTVGEYMKNNFGGAHDRWVTDKEAMRLLNIRSKTSLQSIRDRGLIRFSQPAKKIILYDRLSILRYLDEHAVDVYR